MNMYDSSKIGTKKNEDLALTSPLRELGLIKKNGHEYKFRKVNTSEIPNAVVSFCILDYLEKNNFQKFTPFSNLLNGIKSPGRIFRLNEEMLLEYLGSMKSFTKGYDFDSTAGMQQLIKNSDNRLDKIITLKKVFAEKKDYV